MSWRRRAAAAAAGAVLLTASPAAAAENPVFDAEDDADVAGALAEATEVQDVCYGYRLDVDDGETGQYSGTFAASGAGAGRPVEPSPECSAGTVELVARISYTAEWSEAEDSAAWDLVSSLGALTIADVEALDLSAGDLLDDSRSATTLLNAVLALPRLASEQAGRPPVVLEPNPSPLPEGARATGTPGSDWLRENSALLALSAGAIGAGLLALLASRGAGGRRGHGPPPAHRPPRVRSFGPPPPAGRP